MSNENMANYITDIPSGIAELLAVNKQLEQELQKTRERHEKCMISFGIKLTEVQDKHDELLNELQKTREILEELVKSIYVPYRMGIAVKPNENWKALNDANDLIKQFKDKQGEG